MTAILVALLLSDLATPWTPAALWEAWPRHRFVRTAAPCLRQAELADRLKALEAKHHGRLTLEEVGRSVEGRAIHLLTLGRGPREILLWSQMHGDEPSATPALFDLADLLLSRPDDPVAQAVLERLKLRIVPMLNPDGAERYQRRNAQGIDINRDALNLATPEGRLLKSLRDLLQPELGFNLHDQNRRTTVGDTGALATIALLAVAGDAQGTLTPGRLRARRVCSTVVAALDPFIPGGVSRYDEDWNPRAFGDNLTAWGTPVVLIESGGIPKGLTVEDLTRLNFVALLTVLSGLAKDDLAGADPAVYEALKRNETGARADVVVRGGRVVQPAVAEPYRADVAFDVSTNDLVRAGCGPARRGGSRIVEVGDARMLAAGLEVDARGALIAPGFVAAVRGRAARAWLSAGVLDDLARLGVTTVRWHLAPDEASGMEAFLTPLAAEGRANVEIAPLDAPEAFLRLEGPPKAPGLRSLTQILAALLGPGWRDRLGKRSLVEMLGLLAGGSLPTSDPPPVRLTPEAPASLLVLRPVPPEALDFDRVKLESVWIGGKPVRLEP